MLEKTHPLVIVGAGPAGMYLSIYLSQHGISHLLLDQAKELQNIGFGVLVQENLFTCLEAISIPKNSFSFATITKLEAARTDGIKIIDVHVTNTPIYSTERGEILRVLRNKLETKNLVTNKHVTTIERALGCYRLHLSDGSSIFAKYIVGADGIKSSVRDSLFQKNIVKKVYFALYFWIKNSEKHTMKSLTRGGINTLIMPVGKEESILFITTDKVYNPKENTNEDICKDILTSFGEISNEFLPHILFEKNSLLTTVQRTKSFRFVRGNAVLIGDAAHGETPILGWGTTIALEDAYTLGQLIVKEKKNIKKAFRYYYTFRKKRVRALHMITTIEESLVGIFGKKKSYLRSIILYCVKPFDSFFFNLVRRLYKKLNSHTLNV